MSNYILTSNGKFYSCNSYELYHWGVKGMKWGVRRFQKKDGSLTPAGKKRYDDPQTKSEQEQKKSRAKKVAIASAAIAGTALAAFGAYKLNKAINDKAFKKASEIGKARVDVILGKKKMSWGDLDRLAKEKKYGIKFDTGFDNRKFLIDAETNRAFKNMSYMDKVKNFVGTSAKKAPSIASIKVPRKRG